MRFQRLVQIEAGQAFHVKAGEPHGADEHNAKRVGRILELLVQLPLFHFLAVRPDIQAPCLEGLNLVLFLADDNSHFCFLHPAELPFQFLGFLLGCILDPVFQGFDFLSPVLLHHVIHADAGHLVQADKHGLSTCPEIGVMTDEILGDGFQTRRCGQQMNLLGELRFQLFLLGCIQICILDGLQNAVGKLRMVFYIQNLFTAVFVVQRHGCAVFYCPLEIVHGDVAAEGSFGDIVTGKQRCSRETDTGCRRQ